MKIRYILKNINYIHDEEPYIVENNKTPSGGYFTSNPGSATQYMSEDDAISAIVRLQHSELHSIYHIIYQIIKIYGT